MTAEIGQLRLIVAALSAKLKEPREPPAASVKTSEQPAKPGARCYWCDQAGHFERACPAKESYRQRKRPRRRRRKSKPKGQHQQAPPSAPPQQTAHPNKQQEKPATPVVGRQASGSGCFGRPLRRKDQEATLGAELEWDHEPQVLSFLPSIPAAAPVGHAPAPIPAPAKPAAATTTPIPAADSETQQTAQQQPPVPRHAVTRTSSPGIGSKSSRIPAKAISPVTVNSVVAVKSVAVPRSKRPETVRAKRPAQPAQQVMWRP
nr:hypothetical protein BaRGS_024707 [Batillaria attramentaria]